jgi:hypothetical protein
MNVELESRLTVTERVSPPKVGEMVELSLLVPNQQLMELEAAARSYGVSTGQMLRRLISAFLHEPL